MTNITEELARAMYEADDAWHSAFPWPNLAEIGKADGYRHVAQAILPILDRRIAEARKAGAAEMQERCAVIAEETDTGWFDARTFTAQKIAASIRSLT